MKKTESYHLVRNLPDGSRVYVGPLDLPRSSRLTWKEKVGISLVSLVLWTFVGQWITGFTFSAAEIGASAARGIAPYLEASDDHLTNDAVYRTPSQALREAAAEMDRRDAVIHTLRVDAAIHTLREQLDKCGWMAEPGAFDR